MGRVTLERSPAHFDEVAANLWDLTKDDAWTDFSISVGTTKLPCHRVVLAANSPMLRAAIAADMTERRTGEISLDLFSVAVMEVVLQYMYMGEVTIESRLLKDLLQAADYLQMKVLKQQCIDLIPGNINITPENVISWSLVALQFDLHDITAQCSHIAATSFSEVIQTEEFLALGASEIHDYFDLVQEEVLEDSLLQAALTWVSHNIEERADHLEDLLKTIELENCSQEVLRHQTDLHAELLDSKPKVFKSLFKACIADNQIQNDIKQTKKRRTLRRKISEKIVVIEDPENNYYQNRNCWYLDLKTHRMTKFTEIPDDCYLGVGSVCKTPDGFVVFAGDICAKYITATDSWVRLQNMPVHRYRHGSIWINGKLYVIGGRIDYTETSLVHYLDADGIWQEGPALPWSIGMPVVEGIGIYNVYVLDPDWGRLFVLDLSDTYSPGWKDWFWSAWKQQASSKHQASWKKLASIPYGWHTRDKYSMTAMNDRLYVCSNYIFSYYSPDSDTWCKANAPTPRHFANPLVHYEGKLYLMGSTYVDECNEVEEYDPETQTWTKTGFGFNEVLWDHHAMVLSMPE